VWDAAVKRAGSIMAPLVKRSRDFCTLLPSAAGVVILPCCPSLLTFLRTSALPQLVECWTLPDC